VGGSPGAENFSSSEAPIRLVRFNEMASVTDDVFYLELVNIGDTTLNLNGLRIEVQGSVEATYECSDMMLESGNTFWLSEADLGFIPGEGDRVFLWSADGHLLDAVLADDTLRGRYPDGTGQWLYPSVATLGETNIFDISQDIVINEIMYHPIVIPAMPVEIETVTVVQEDAACSVYVPNDDSLGTEWTGGDDSFSDLDWTDGIGSTSGVGYEKGTGYEPYIGTDVSNEMYGVNASVYLRIHFDMADPNTFDGLLLSMRFDDGFIAYLNGTEVARYNAPENAAWDSLSTTGNSDSQAMVFQVFDISAYMYSLSPGHNILAVHGLNVSSTSSDLLVQPLLAGVKILDPNVAVLPEGEESKSWVELYNRGMETVDLSDWSFTDGINFTFPQGTTMEPGEYLVVSENAPWLSSRFPDARIIGDFGGNLSNRGETLVLSDQYGNPADTIRYYDGGTWPEYADGGGCSMELIDPFADNNRAEAWAASNELGRSPWQEYVYPMVAGSSPVGNDNLYSEFVMGLLDQGEILIDDIQVIEDPDGAAYQLLQNSNFTNDTEKWRIIGNHSTSVVVSDPEDSSNNVLKLIATGPTEHMSNHAETTLANSRRVGNGKFYEIRFRARWVAGTPLLNTRLFFNRVASTTYLDVPERNGTPGEVNSQAKPNIGPTFSSLTHAPAVPLPHQTVNVTVRSEDPDGIFLISLFYREDDGIWYSAQMIDEGDSWHSGTIPGYSSGTKVQFYITAWDDLLERSYYPAAGPASFAQYEVLGQMPRDTGVHNYRVVMRNDQKEKLYELTNLMSNEYLGATLIVNESDIYYNIGVRLKSSEHGRPPNKQAGRIGFSMRFEAQNLFRGVHKGLGFDRSNGQNVGQQEMLLHAAMNRFGGPSKYHDLGYIMAPNPAHSSGAEVQMARFNKLFCEESYGDEGGSGTLYEYELVYPLTQTVGNNPEGLKIPQEGGGYQGLAIDVYLGQDKEKYRWHFLIKNNRDEDNYDPIMRLTQAFSQSGDAFKQAIEETLDVDHWMRSFAVGAGYGPNDNWATGGLQHNAFFYHRPSDDKVLYFIHDLDYVNQNASLKSNSYLKDITENPHWDHYFYGYVYDFLQTSFNREYMSYWADHYASLLPEQSWSSWLNYIGNRNSNVQRQLNSALPDEIPFEISNVSVTIENNRLPRVHGQGWINVRWILIVETGTVLDTTWDSLTHWYADFDTGQEPGIYTLEAYDSQGNILGTDTFQLVLP
jgi:hypothetical protein